MWTCNIYVKTYMYIYIFTLTVGRSGSATIGIHQRLAIKSKSPPPPSSCIMYYLENYWLFFYTFKLPRLLIVCFYTSTTKNLENNKYTKRINIISCPQYQDSTSSGWYINTVWSSFSTFDFRVLKKMLSADKTKEADFREVKFKIRRIWSLHPYSHALRHYLSHVQFHTQHCRIRCNLKLRFLETSSYIPWNEVHSETKPNNKVMNSVYCQVSKCEESLKNAIYIRVYISDCICIYTSVQIFLDASVPLIPLTFSTRPKCHDNNDARSTILSSLRQWQGKSQMSSETKRESPYRI